MEWVMRMRDAIDWMEEQLPGPVDIDQVATHAYSSPFHFQRMFHMLTGVTVAEYVRNRRLTLAAQELATSSVKVIDVAQKYGYESPESFAKAFRKLHGMSPSDARRPGAHLKAFPRLSFHLSIKGDQDMDYRIVERESFQVLGKEIRVSYKDGENFRAIPKFWQACYANGTVAALRASRQDGVLIGICADTDHAAEQFTYAIVAENTASTGLSQLDDVTVRTIPAATWAVFPSSGALPNAIQSVWDRIFSEWFPGTGYEHSGGPELEVLPPGDDTADDYSCEVWIPIVKR
ncbi:AraC family transcriptional regulator [Alicyclobacillus sp. ALC3]|uniref:AraC family transcriptional regulator n=1 Tax=Alicyclobacillus sp. ALC3 TaxID=2796143 RepID=UPI0023793742|nr:AraC family transcriptional regulator [Alicyclobacillus sp. ALC3]WDL98621.1 AraC family transcriptional regulator [Alicyclobacillus sp. ALC3]